MRLRGIGGGSVILRQGRTEAETWQRVARLLAGYIEHGTARTNGVRLRTADAALAWAAGVVLEEVEG